MLYTLRVWCSRDGMVRDAGNEFSDKVFESDADAVEYALESVQWLRRMGRYGNVSWELVDGDNKIVARGQHGNN